MFKKIIIAATLLITPCTAYSDETTVLTWNVAGAERDAEAVGKSVSDMVEQVGSADILILQEVIAVEQVEAIAGALGMQHWVISDFSPPESITNNPFASLEVAIVSAAPIVHAAEWDTTGQAPNGDNFPPRTSSGSTLTEELPIEIGLNAAPRRGFLRAEIEDGPIVYAVHWKSSRGQSCNSDDIGNALQREDQARGLFHDASELVEDGYDLIVGGDFNIQAPGKALRVGTTLQEDCSPNGDCSGVCGDGGLDGYDDSIAILLDLPEARILSGELGPTFIGFATDSGAIDHLIVAGDHASMFDVASAPTVTDASFHGSDHRPVIASADFARSDENSDQRIRVLLSEIDERMEAIRTLLDQ